MSNNPDDKQKTNDPDTGNQDNIQVLCPKAFSYSVEAIKRYPRIKKHNRTVLFLKLLMPSFAVIAIALMILWPRLVEQKNKFHLGLSRPLIVSQTENLSIVNSKFFSADNKNQPFVLSAELAMETQPNSRIISLTKPKASILLNSGTRIMVDSMTGTLYQKQNEIILNNGCNAESDKGHNLKTEEILIDLNDNSMVSNSKTYFSFPHGRIESEGLYVENKGDIIKFTGHANMLITPTTEKVK